LQRARRRGRCATSESCGAVGLDGLINLNKPAGISSAKALYRVRKVTGVRKSGHAGTLDPAADGVLILCLGRATKLVERLMNLPKVYRAVARLDVTSASFDSDRPLAPVAVSSTPSRDVVVAQLQSFEGVFDQIPPAISAVKVGGVPAYRRVHQGQSLELKARPVRIYWVHVHRYKWPLLDFELACGRGAYVRAVIRDLGQRLATGGVLTRLTRRAVGPFTVDAAISLERLAAGGWPIADDDPASTWLTPLADAQCLLALDAPAPPPPTGTSSG